MALLLCSVVILFVVITNIPNSLSSLASPVEAAQYKQIPLYLHAIALGTAMKQRRTRLTVRYRLIGTRESFQRGEVRQQAHEHLRAHVLQRLGYVFYGRFHMAFSLRDEVSFDADFCRSFSI